MASGNIALLLYKSILGSVETVGTIIADLTAATKCAVYKLSRVLITDDDADLRAILRYFLEYRGIVVTEAKNGTETLELLNANSYDILVLDLLMPIQDGFTTLKLIRADVRFSTLPVIILSSLAQDVNITRAKRLGASDFIKKPFSPDELYSRLKRFIPLEQSTVDAE